MHDIEPLKAIHHNPETILEHGGTAYRFFKSGLLSDLFPCILETHVLIRDEYEQAYTYIDEEHQRARLDVRGKSPSFVITGQPGNGKSTFLAYVLIKRLQRKLPTAVEIAGSGYVLFGEPGVVLYLGREKPCNGRYKNLSDVWALSDSSPDNHIPCIAFRNSHSVLIQATCPEQHRWHEWAKTPRVSVFIGRMDLW
ncbi:hypothetical protein BC835DRAFT_1413996 [Cytidiella melzeri]|nr:hypothetical protein BC835DRAFT_1413996 [Cytidiella melzeri]